MKTSEQLNELAAALAKAQAEMDPVIKSKTAEIGKYRYSYADLGSVIETAHGTLAKHGLSIAAPFEIDERGEMILVMCLLHESGQQMVSRYPIRPLNDSPQGVASAISYARRYVMMSLVNLPAADDDGQAAMGRNDDAHVPHSRRPQYDPQQVPETLRGAPRPAQSAKRRPGRPPAQPAPVETSELFQEVMETIREAGSFEELSTASELAMGLDGEERDNARAAYRQRQEALKGAASRSDAARDSIKATLTLPKPA